MFLHLFVKYIDNPGHFDSTIVFKLLIFISGDIDPNNVFQAFFGDQMGQPGFNFGGNQFPGGGFSFHFQ